MKFSENNKLLKILVAEDNHVDQHIIVQEMKENNMLNEIFIVDDGVEAMEFLQRVGKYADPEISPKPDIVLLDIKMPRMDGKEVLQQIKREPLLKSIPIIIVTTSDYEKHIIESYKLDVKGYISKPFAFNQFMDAVIDLKCFGLCLVKLP